jgi:hypothetical protein
MYVIIYLASCSHSVRNKSVILNDFEELNVCLNVFGKFVIHTSVVMIPVAARSKVWVCALSLAGILGSNLAGGMDIFLF